ncbi:hypothetical protein [Nannocystis pusilla]|uniref:hypothetical protein n=1 Tax=Nannocystis pusilla TaxID=889268 RepID=UPI003B77FE56
MAVNEAPVRVRELVRRELAEERGDGDRTLGMRLDVGFEDVGVDVDDGPAVRPGCRLPDRVGVEAESRLEAPPQRLSGSSA